MAFHEAAVDWLNPTPLEGDTNGPVPFGDHLLGQLFIDLGAEDDDIEIADQSVHPSTRG